jgi:capsular polysaccharide transport system permease protein
MRRIHRLFLLAVVLPTVLSGLYFGMVASDVYISESRFVVRSPQRPAQAGLGALLQGTVLSRSQDDAFAVHDFIRSRDALTELDGKLKVRAAYSSTDIDVFNRFPGLDPDDSFEAFHRYYQKQLGVDFDSASSITVLRIRAFSAQDAKAANEMLLEMGERLVNNMNLRSRRDLIEVAEKEVKLAEARAKAAADALSSFRGDRGVLDPERQGAQQLQAVEKLREELLQAETQLAQLKQLSPANPQVKPLETRVAILKRAIAAENARVLSKKGGLSTKAPSYDRLTLEKAFAERQLAAALSALDTARSEAVRKQLYLERLVQPSLPDSAVEPRRIRGVVTTFLLGLVLWGVLALVVASVREHVD